VSCCPPEQHQLSGTAQPWSHHAPCCAAENEAIHIDSRELSWRLRQQYVDPANSRSTKRSAADPHASLHVSGRSAWRVAQCSWTPPPPPAGCTSDVPRPGTHCTYRLVLQVPVFVFLLDRDVPILIDEHYNARALEDMVLVVANAAHQ